MKALHPILIVDDEPNQRLLLEQTLRPLAHNHPIITVHSVDAAIACLDTLPALVITDYQMPTCDGLALIAHMRNLDLQTSIILITAYYSPDLHDAARRLRVDHCLTKPVPLALLRRLASAALLSSLAQAA